MRLSKLIVLMVLKRQGLSFQRCYPTSTSPNTRAHQPSKCSSSRIRKWLKCRRYNLSFNNLSFNNPSFNNMNQQSQSTETKQQDSATKMMMNLMLVVETLTSLLCSKCNSILYRKQPHTTMASLASKNLLLLMKAQTISTYLTSLFLNIRMYL